MAYEQEKKFLAESDAVRVSYWSNPQTGHAVLVRRWKTSRGDLHASMVAYLNTIKIVTNPQAIADGKSKPYPGVWRVLPFAASLPKGNKEEQGITQTLVLAPGDGNMKWASMDSTLECMYSYAYRDQAAPIQVQKSVQGVVTEAQNTLNDKMLYDAEASRLHSHPYQWPTHIAENALGEADNIGYKNYRTRPEAPASTVQGTVYDAKSTLNKDGGYDGDVVYGTSKAKVLAGKVSESVLDVGYDVAYTNGRTRPAMPATTVQGLVYDAKSTVNKDDTYDGDVGYVASKPVAWSDVTETATDTSASNSYHNYRTKPSAPSTAAVGFVYDAKLTINKDETYSGGVGYEYSKPVMMSSVAEAALSTGYALDYLAYRERPTAPASTVQGVFYDAKSTLNRDNTYGGGVNYDYSKPKMWTDEAQTATGISSVNSYLSYRTRPVAPTSDAVGFIYNAKSTINKDNTYDGNAGYEYSKPARWVDVVDAALGTSVGHSYLNQREQRAAPSTLAQGFLYDGKSTLNKDSTYDGNVGYEYSKPDQWTDVAENALTKDVALAYQNSRTRPAAPASAVQGCVYEIKTTDNKDGTYGGGVGYKYSNPDHWVDATENALGKTVGHSYLNYRTRPAAPTSAVQGFDYSAKTTDNNDGTYGGGVGYEYSKSVQTPSQIMNSILAAGYEVAYQSSRTKPAVPASTIGWAYEAKSTLGKDSTYTGEIGYDYAKPVELYLTWTTNRGTAGLRQYKNWQSIPATIAALTNNTNNHISAGYNNNGSMDIGVGIHPVPWSTGGVNFQFNTSSWKTVPVREVLGYNNSASKYSIQMWTRCEKYFRNKDTGLDAINSTAKTAAISGVTNGQAERVSITLQSLGGYGSWWLIIFYVRQVDAVKNASSIGTADD